MTLTQWLISLVIVVTVFGILSWLSTPSIGYHELGTEDDDA